MDSVTTNDKKWRKLIIENIVKQTGREIKIKHSGTEMTDWSEQSITASERCAVWCSQHDVLSSSAQGFINLHMPVLTWWMCVFGAVKPDQYFTVEHSSLGWDPWKFTSTLSGSEEDSLISYGATKQTELLFPLKQTRECWAPAPNLAICQTAQEQVPAAAFPKAPAAVH